MFVNGYSLMYSVGSIDTKINCIKNQKFANFKKGNHVMIIEKENPEIFTTAYQINYSIIS